MITWSRTVGLRRHHTFACESLVSWSACEDPFEVVFGLDLLDLPSGLRRSVTRYMLGCHVVAV